MSLLSRFFDVTTYPALIIRYLLVAIIRYAWASLTSWYAGDWWIYLVPFSIPGPQLNLQAIIQVGLIVPQIFLLWRLLLIVINRTPDASAKDTLRPRSSSWLTTPLLLSFIIIVTCCVIFWLGESARVGGLVPFVPYMLYATSLPVMIGAGLSVLGFLAGSGFVARAKSSVGGLFGVKYLPENHPLSQRVARHAATLNLPTSPAVGVVNVMNAFAIGTHKNSAVVLGQPLLTLLSEEELDAVIGHELGHIYHSDMHRMQFAEGFQRTLGNLISSTIAIIVSAVSRNRSEAMLGQSLGDLVRVTVFMGSELVVKGISRNREFHADAVGARVSSPAAMIGALERIHGVPAKPTRLEAQYGYLMFRGSRLGSLFSTHPHLDARVRALNALATAVEPTPTPENTGTDNVEYAEKG